MSSTDTYPSHEQQTLVWPERPAGVKSEYGLFNIIDFMPREGEDGMVLTVETMFDVDPHRHLCVRLIIGHICTTTTVRTIIPQSEHQAAFIRVECTVPDFSKHQTQNPSVPITIQAMDGQDRVVDGITFGNFTYWQNGELLLSWLHKRGVLTNGLALQGESANLGHPRSLVHPTPLRPGAVPTEPLSLPSNHKASGRHARRDHASSLTSQLLRRPEGATPRKGKAEKAALQFINSVEDMSKDFTPEEYQAGRRLVRFSRTQDGNKLCVSCEAITPDDYTEGDIVASCIIRDNREEPCVTSVDIIVLLQRLVQDSFSVEEKNRIRRNLEGFHPATIAKTKPDTEVFFRRIMDFPEPKPRNIEKDVKVFEWTVLPAALEKIIHKYVHTPLGTFFFSLD